jgi:hypothetical protein
LTNHSSSYHKKPHVLVHGVVTRQKCCRFKVLRT